MSKIKNELNKEEINEEVSSCNCKNDEACTCDEESCECEHCHNDDVTSPEEEEILVLRNTVENLEEKARLYQAELINYRKRKDEEVSNMLKYANQDLIMEILPVVDNFERAIKMSEKDDNTAKMVEGFKMLYNNLLNTLKRFGVEEIKSTGEKFDPNYHEALLIENDSTKEDDIVVETLITGYTLKERVIRPASVKVNKLN